MACSLSNLANNLAEETHKIKCKYGHDDKKAKLNSKIASAFLNSLTLKMIANANANVYVGVRIIKKSLVEKLKERFLTTHEFLKTTIISLFYCCEKVFLVINI